MGVKFTLDSRNDKLKKYYLKNIRQISVEDVSFQSTAKLEQLLDNSLSVWFQKDVEPYKVVLQISSEVSKYFKRKPISKAQVIESMYEDGGMVLSVEITNDMEIIPLIKYWMPHIMVLEPTRIATKIKNDFEKYIMKTNT